MFTAFFGVVSVYPSVKQNIWSWLTAIVNVGLYTFVFHASRLYADMGLVLHRTTNAAIPNLDSLTTGLYLVFLVLSVMGYRQWKASLSERDLASAQAA